MTGSSTTIYIGKLYEETGGVSTNYIFAGSTRIASRTTADTYYYHQDHLGSSSVITDSSGVKVEEIHYYPFGETLSDTSPTTTKHKYTSQELDTETGLYYYNARYYDPALGRFISADTIVPDPTNPQALNRYSYVINNPLKYTDPSGHGFFDSIGKVFKSAGKAVQSVLSKPEVKFAIGVLTTIQGFGEGGNPWFVLLGLTQMAQAANDFGDSGRSRRNQADGGSPARTKASGRAFYGKNPNRGLGSYGSGASTPTVNLTEQGEGTIYAIARALNVNKIIELRKRAFGSSEDPYKHQKAHWDYGQYIGNADVARNFAYLLELVQYPWFTAIDSWNKVVHGKPGEFQPSSFDPNAPGGRFDARQDIQDTVYGAKGIPLYFPDGSIYYGR